jgi:hypothetical protein
MRKAREDRMRRKLMSLQSWETDDSQRGPLLRFKDTIAAFVSNEEQTTKDLHDTLEACYKVARKRFVDAVCFQAWDYFLISNKEGLLWLSSPHFVGGLSNSDLSKIAGEGDGAAMRRVRLEEEIATLKAGEVILVG